LKLKFVGGQFHAPAALSPGKRPPISTGWEAARDTEMAWEVQDEIFLGASSPLCWFNSKGIFVYYTSRLTQLYYLIY